MNLKLLSVAAFVCFAQVYASTDLQLPQEELAKETVLPVVDRPEMVRSRKVKTEGKWELGANFGWLMSEPIYDVTRFGLAAYKHTSEESAWGAQFYYNSAGRSDYSTQLHSQFGLDYDRAPKPQFSLFGDYNRKLFYGKMSVAKNSTINTHLMALFSAGFTQYENKAYPGVTGGVGYKFYFSPTFSLRTDLRLFVHDAPIPFKRGAITDGSHGSTPTTAPDKNSFKDRITYTNILDIGLDWLF